MGEGGLLQIIYLLLPLSLFIGALFLALCIWAIKTGQYDKKNGKDILPLRKE